MNQSEQINELATALAKAQGEIMPAIKDSKNPFYKSSYADLSSVWSACKEPLSRNGLAVMQTMDHMQVGLVLVTTLAHSSGQWMRSIMPIVTEKNNAQGIGASITYMRRYALSAMVGVTCDEDDDGNASVIMPEKKKVAEQVAPTASPDAPGKTISIQQARQLDAMLKECDADFQKNLWLFLKKELKGVEKMEQLPFDQYHRIRNNIVKKREENLNHASLGEPVYA